MKVKGCDCSIIIKTAYREFDVPYSEETIREAVSLLQEEASIEGDGVCKAIKKKSGVTGCVVTPLTIGTTHLLIYLAMGSAGLPVYVSETRSIYKYTLNLLPMEDTECFDLIQDRIGTNNERLFYEGCRIKGFELRVMRGEAIKLKLDVYGDNFARIYPYTDTYERENGERFFGDNINYRINEKEYSNIYGITILGKKVGGTRTEIWIKRSLEKNGDIPELIEEMTITAFLHKDKYEYRHFGQFRITLKRLVLVSDETDVNASDAVVGPLRYYVSGTVFAEVFTSTGEKIQ